MMLTAILLQTPGILLNGRPVAFPFKRADALLYYMLVRRSATRQELISLLWESCDEEVGLKNLRNALYTLKKSLGDLLLSPQKSLVVLNDQWEIDCDYDRFTRGGDFSAYQGPFLQGFSVKNAFAYEEWIGRTREKLHAQYLSLLAHHAQEAEDAGDFPSAQQYASDYLREDPLDEKMASFLMTLYRKAAQYPKAAQVYQRLKEALTEELGADPLKQTTALYYEIMNEWNDTSAPEEDGPRIPVPVGREAAYARLRGSAAAFAGEAVRQRSLLLIGEAGSGKSELINHFLRDCALSEFRVLRNACLLSEAETPLACFAPLMLSMLRSGEDPAQETIPAAARERLACAFPILERGERPVSEKAARRTDPALTDIMLQLFSAASRQRKVLLILEDIQWIDRESLALLDALLRRGEPGRLMAVLSCRDNCPGEILGWIEGRIADGLLLEQRLLPLTELETAEFLRRELGDEPAGQLAGQFYRETGGNLYLLTELTAAYRQSGDIDQIIATMSDILLGRITGLSPAGVHAAGLIALFPEAAPCALLSGLFGPDDPPPNDGIGELFRRGLIFEQHGKDGPAYRFTHPRIRELVYERQSFFQRKPLHLRAAALMSQPGGPATAASLRGIAWHYQQAGEALPALVCQIRALEQESSLCCEPFPVLIERQIPELSLAELKGRLADAQRQLAALRGAGDANRLVLCERMLSLIGGRIALFEGRFSDGVTLLGRLSEQCGSDEEETMFLRACRLLASHALNTQAADLAERYTAAGTHLLERREDPARLAMFERLRGGIFCLRGEYDKSVYYLLEAIDALQKLPDRDAYRLQLAAACYDYGRVCRQRLDYAEACSHYKKALALIGEGTPCPGAVWIYVHYGRAAFALGDDGRARSLFRQGCALGKRTGERSGVAASAAFCAYYDALDDNFDQAADRLIDAQQLSDEIRSPLEAVILCFVKMKLRAMLDRGRRSGTRLDRLLPYSTESYARQGTRLLAGVPDVFEADLLAASLREGIARKRTFSAPELYSKNKHFMTE